MLIATALYGELDAVTARNRLDKKVIEVEVERLRKKARTSLFVVISRRLDVPVPTFHREIDGTGFSIVLDGWGDASFIEEFRRIIAAVAVSFTLSFGRSSSDPLFRTAGLCSYINPHRPTYAVRFALRAYSPSISVGAPPGAADEAAALFARVGRAP